METRVWASAQKSQSSNGKLLNILCVYEKGSTHKYIYKYMFDCIEKLYMKCGKSFYSFSFYIQTKKRTQSFIFLLCK